MSTEIILTFAVLGITINVQTQFFYNVEAPASGDDWSARFQLQFLFPK